VPRLDMVRPLAQAFVAGPVARMCTLAVSLLPRMHMCCLKLGAPPAPPEESNAALWPPLSVWWRTTRNHVLKVCKGFRADAAADAAVTRIFWICTVSLWTMRQCCRAAFFVAQARPQRLQGKLAARSISGIWGATARSRMEAEREIYQMSSFPFRIVPSRPLLRIVLTRLHSMSL